MNICIPRIQLAYVQSELADMLEKASAMRQEVELLKKSLPPKTLSPLSTDSGVISTSPKTVNVGKTNNNVIQNTAEKLKNDVIPLKYGIIIRACQKDQSKKVPIGFGKTQISKAVFDKINWNAYTVATRKLLAAVFSRQILATHTLTGKPSPAFNNKPAKLCLDQRKVADIIMVVAEKCKVKDNLIRTVITTKCADESRRMRKQSGKLTHVPI